MDPYHRAKAHDTVNKYRWRTLASWITCLALSSTLWRQRFRIHYKKNMTFWTIVLKYCRWVKHFSTALLLVLPESSLVSKRSSSSHCGCLWGHRGVDCLVSCTNHFFTATDSDIWAGASCWSNLFGCIYHLFLHIWNTCVHKHNKKS